MSWLTDKSLSTKVKKNARAKTLEAFNGIYSIDTLTKDCSQSEKTIHSLVVYLGKT